MQDDLKQIFNTIYDYFFILWGNPYTRWFIFFLIYLLFLYIILIPLFKRFFVFFINKTKINLNDKFYNQNKILLKNFLFLIWIIIIYKLYFVNLENIFIAILYKIILTINYIVIYIILHKGLKLIFKIIKTKYLNKNITNLINLIIDIFVISIILLLILSSWNINITPLLAWAGILGLAVAMASKNIIENFLSWLIIFSDKSLNVGDDIILSDGTLCTIEEINIRTTILKTFEWNIVIIPNSDFLNQKIVNISLAEIADKKRVEVNVSISYWDDVDKAKDLLSFYLKELDWADENSVIVFVSSLSNWSVDITWRIMVDAKKWDYLMPYKINEKVYKEFPKNWLNFPFPTYTIDGKQITINN